MIQDLAARLRTAQADRTPCAPLSAELPPDDEASGYAIQEANTRHALATGRRLSGRKIGLTAASVQRQMGVGQPDYGMLFHDMAFADGQDIPAGLLIQPRIEGEVAFVLARALEAPGLVLDDVVRAVDHAVAAFEIVDSRIEGWRIRLLDTVADNASSGAYVLGQSRVGLEGLDLEGCAMELLRNGATASTGTGRECMGNPLQAALWLARKMVEVGRPLQAGDVILSGALGPMVPAAPGDCFMLRISGLGSVATRFVR